MHKLKNSNQSAHLHSLVRVLVFSLPLWESVIVLGFVVRYFMSILVLQSP